MTQAPRTHDAWLVDLDGTLYRPLPLKLLMAAELLMAGRRKLEVIRRFRHEHECLRHEGAECDPTPFHAQLARTALGMALPEDEVEALVRDYMIRRPCRYLKGLRRRELLAEISIFRNDGGRTALVSDYPATDKLKSLSAFELFDRVIASGEPGGPRHLKPSPDGFLLAAEALGVEPNRCLVIGDRDDADGEAARAAGMEFRWIK